MAKRRNRREARRRRNYREARKAWELLHEESGFEDLGAQFDPNISDLDGQETHLHFLVRCPAALSARHW